MLADGHTLFRRGLKTLLASETDLEIVAELGSLSGGYGGGKAADARTRWSWILNCWRTPMTRRMLEMRQMAASTGLLFLTEQDTPEHLEKAMGAGARGYMLKNSPAPNWWQASGEWLSKMIKTLAAFALYLRLEGLGGVEQLSAAFRTDAA